MRGACKSVLHGGLEHAAVCIDTHLRTYIRTYVPVGIFQKASFHIHFSVWTRECKSPAHTMAQPRG